MKHLYTFFVGERYNVFMAKIDPTRRTFISYIDRTREFYRAQGYSRPYEWAHYEEVPFVIAEKPVAELRVALVTTASPMLNSTNLTERPSKSPWSAPTNAPPDALYTEDLAWDKGATHTKDPETFLPIKAWEALISQGSLGELTERFHGVPTEYSKRRTIERDAPEILTRLREDEAEAAILVPL